MLSYLAPEPEAGTPAPLIVVQDGMGYTNLLPVVLDNMIADHRLPAMVAVMIYRPRGLVSARTPSVFLRRRKDVPPELGAEARTESPAS